MNITGVPLSPRFTTADLYVLEEKLEECYGEVS
jgi:hypothetical protein